MHPEQNPQGHVRFAGFCVWGWMKEDIRMQRPRYGHRHGYGQGGGRRSHYGGILSEA